MKDVASSSSLVSSSRYRSTAANLYELIIRWIYRYSMFMCPVLVGRINESKVSFILDNVLYPDQIPVLVGKSKVTDEDDIKKGIICVTNRSIIFYSDREANASDYELIKATEITVKKSCFFSSEIEIKMVTSQETTQMDSSSVRLITLTNVPKGEEEKIIAILKQTLYERRGYVSEQKSKGLVRYDLGVEKWGSKQEAIGWLESYLLNRGFKKIDNKWLTNQEYLDYQQKQKGLYKYIQSGKEMWGTIDEYLEGITPKKFEELIGLLFKIMSYNVKNLPYIGDYGADLLIEKEDKIIIIQTKKYSLGNNVGAPEVQRVLGAMWHYHANKAILVTTSKFTYPARKQAEGAPIDLWDRERLKEELSKHLPSNLIEEKPITFYPKAKLKQFSKQLEKLWKKIILEVTSNLDSHIAMRIKYRFLFDPQLKTIGVRISGPVEYQPILQRLIRTYIMKSQNSLINGVLQDWLNQTIKNELEWFKESYPQLFEV